MARDNLAACLAEIFAHEGGYVDHPKDPGGVTNFGITRATLAAWRGRPVSRDEVRDLTRGEAEAIYRARYWAPVKGDALPPGLDLVALDAAVNSGVPRSVQWLQRALGVPADGRIGPVTLQAAQAAAPAEVIARACALRRGFLQGLRGWGSFGRGWSRRLARVEATALRMAAGQGRSSAAPVLIAAMVAAETRVRRATIQVGGSVAGGGAGATLADLPDWAWPLLAVAVVLAVINLVGRGRHDRDRAAAFEAAAKAVLA